MLGHNKTGWRPLKTVYLSSPWPSKPTFCPPFFFFFFCMKLIANLQDERTPYGTKGDAAQYAR
ncbi:BQ5605_C031g10898 [Microbotryum silenes-dioicae]|uniref:BQ5605_C031g10898 protein n=1 Tax=Microbotryum silenes-dioicae TaxID=796604 RepID=A0A2X0MHM0_9BASI|nr:BQ5605_C031g10898 [Microbotryum silenes-dioicae]